MSAKEGAKTSYNNNLSCRLRYNPTHMGYVGSLVHSTDWRTLISLEGRLQRSGNPNPSGLYATRVLKFFFSHATKSSEDDTL